MSGGTSQVAPPETLVGLVWPAEPRRLNAFWRAGVLAFIGAALLVVSAKIQAPRVLLPLTLQSLAVLLVAAAYGARLALATVALYLVAGLCRLPVFTGPAAGLPDFIGPAGGYLGGLVMAAAAVGFLAERRWDRLWTRLIPMMMIGEALYMAAGMGWLAVRFGPKMAWSLGGKPFWLAALLQATLAAALSGAGWSLIESRRSGRR